MIGKQFSVYQYVYFIIGKRNYVETGALEDFDFGSEVYGGEYVALHNAYLFRGSLEGDFAAGRFGEEESLYNVAVFKLKTGLEAVVTIIGYGLVVDVYRAIDD